MIVAASLLTREVAGSKPAAPMGHIVRMAAHSPASQAVSGGLRGDAGRFAPRRDATVTHAAHRSDARQAPDA
jgi:hypothetical protein